MSVESLMAKANEGISAGRAFGPVIEGEGCTIIPVAFTVGGGGGGDAPAEEGVSVGGGFGSLSWPIGVYVVKDGNVRWVPAIDTTFIALVASTVLRTLVRRVRRRH